MSETGVKAKFSIGFPTILDHTWPIIRFSSMSLRSKRDLHMAR